MEKIDKVWGWEEIIIKTPFYVMKYLCISAGKRLSLQYHREKTETLLLLCGKVFYILGDDKGYLNKKLPLHIPAGIIHRLEAKRFSIVLEVSTPQLDDVVRIEDDYGRV